MQSAFVCKWQLHSYDCSKSNAIFTQMQSSASVVHSNAFSVLVHLSAFEWKTDAICARMHSNALECTRMHSDALKCTQMQFVIWCTSVHLSAFECIRVTMAFCTQMHSNALECTQMHSNAVGVLMHLSAFECIRVHLNAFECIWVQNANALAFTPSPQFNHYLRYSCRCYPCFPRHFIKYITAHSSEAAPGIC